MVVVLEKHPLEGSCQEAIPLPSTTFDIFPVVFRSVDPHSRLVAADASLFSYAWCRSCGRRTKHPSGSRPLTSRSHTRRPPLAPSVPQKTISSLPCPIVDCAQMSWLPWGSRFSLAHGRGVAKLHNPIAGHLGGGRSGRIRWAGCQPLFEPVSNAPPGSSLSQTLYGPQRGRDRA